MRSRFKTSFSRRSAGMALAAAFLLTSVPSSMAGSRQDATVLLSEHPGMRKSQEEWGYSDAVISGDTIYLSGVATGPRPGETDLEPAYTRAFERIGSILARAGASWDDVLEISSFHTDISAQLPVMVKVKNRYVKQPPPAWTAIQISRLVMDQAVTEIRVVAKKPEKK